MIATNFEKAFVFDLDGTLLNQQHQITNPTILAIKQLYQKNNLVIVATGRHHLDAYPIIQKLEIPVYLITSNGARIHCPKKELLFAENMPPEIVKEIIFCCEDEEITTVLFKENVWQTNKHNETLNNFQPEMNYLPEIVNYKELHDFEAIKVFFTHTSHQKLKKLQTEILLKCGQNYSHAFSLPLCLEFWNETVDKSIAVAKVLERYGITFKNTIAFGDGFNDEKMLLKASKALLMQNASEDLKTKLANLEVISPNYDDGVAKYLQQNFL